MQQDDALGDLWGEMKVAPRPLKGFHLQAESPSCLDMKRSESFQAYLRQIVLEFEWVLKVGGTDM